MDGFGQHPCSVAVAVADSNFDADTQSDTIADSDTVSAHEFRTFDKRGNGDGIEPTKSCFISDRRQLGLGDRRSVEG